MPSLDKRTRLRSFGAATGLLFGHESGAVEVALAPLEFKRLLEAWSDHELSRRTPDSEVLQALRQLLKKSRTKAPHLIIEAPIASSGRAALVPDHEYLSRETDPTSNRSDV